MIARQNRYAYTIYRICEAIRSHNPLDWTLEENDRTLCAQLQVGQRKASLKLCSPFNPLAIENSRVGNGLSRWIQSGECHFEGDVRAVKFRKDHAQMLFSAVEQSLAQNIGAIRRRLQQVLSDVPQIVTHGSSTALSDWRIEIASIKKNKGASEPSFVFYRDTGNIRIRVSQQMKRTFGLSRHVCEVKASLIDHIVKAEETVHGREAIAVYDCLSSSHFGAIS